jgi:hypothetical protein
MDDDKKSYMSPAVYQTPPGKHRIYCTLPGGTRHLVTAITIPEMDPGVPFRIQIQKGDDGIPRLDPKMTTRPRQPDPTPAEKPASPSAPPQ